MIVQIRRHFRLILNYIDINWKNSTEYRKDFIILFFDFIVITLLSIIFWRAVFGNTDQLGNWQFEELVILGIFGSTSWALSDFFAGAWQLPEKITQGALDKYLTKPIHPLFAAIMESMQLEETCKGVLAFTLLSIVASVKYNYSITITNVLLSIVILVIGVCIISLMRIFFSLFTFWIGQSNGLNVILHLEDFNFERYPIDIFGKYLKYLLTWCIPVGYLATYPTVIFLRKSENNLIIFLLGVLVLATWFIIVSFLWKRGIKRYEANGG
ncbi:hypothetical protein F8154_08145 [Alkaliphilus pronyensis]|uniref:ABC transporter permease n=1 Tax=Alkaliphilus pronyensis TaxID=1482732 RepID=A0A6I0F8J0_9FIRM|nr:ABC-2 family transporter protein [Alkaliphilus pronyensis]KAB3534823.1 hypothetical protein F8154_08145 [Alkaliphilus pronyensis]